MRPPALHDCIVQWLNIGDGQLLRRAIQTDQLSSVILYGPPGTAFWPAEQADLWMRNTFTIAASDISRLGIWCRHDDSIGVHIKGARAARSTESIQSILGQHGRVKIVNTKHERNKIKVPQPISQTQGRLLFSKQPSVLLPG